MKKELSENQTMLVLVPPMVYNDIVNETARELSNSSVCYVTLNKTFDSLVELFKKSKIDVSDIVFVDAISKTIKSVPDQTNQCYFVSSPGALTELSLVISKFLRHNFEYLVFDSLTNLMIYEKKSPVGKFLSNLANKIRESKTKALFYALKTDEHKELVQECSMFVDKVIDLEK